MCRVPTKAYIPRFEKIEFRKRCHHKRYTECFARPHHEVESGKATAMRDMYGRVLTPRNTTIPVDGTILARKKTMPLWPTDVHELLFTTSGGSTSSRGECHRGRG